MDAAGERDQPPEPQVMTVDDETLGEDEQPQVTTVDEQPPVNEQPPGRSIHHNNRGRIMYLHRQFRASLALQMHSESRTVNTTLGTASRVISASNSAGTEGLINCGAVVPP